MTKDEQLWLAVTKSADALAKYARRLLMSEAKRTHGHPSPRLRLTSVASAKEVGLASANAPTAGGVDVVFNGRRLLYVGETADLKRRLRNLKRRWGHDACALAMSNKGSNVPLALQRVTVVSPSTRRSVGRKRFRAKTGADGRFPAQIEAKLDKFLLEECRYSFLPIRFGRKEVESFLIRRDKPTHNNRAAE